MKKGEEITLTKYDERAWVLPCVVDFIPFEQHCAVDIIQLDGESFKKDQIINFGDIKMIVVKKLKDYPIQTELKIENRLSIRKIRYFCNKL